VSSSSVEVSVAARAIPVRVGEVELWVETTPVAGTEATSKLQKTAEGVVDAFAQIQQAIIEVAGAVVGVIEEAAKRAARPDHLDVEFGLKLSAEGNVVVAGVSAESTLRVKLTYDAKAPRPA
jgi:hypothetical protein